MRKSNPDLVAIVNANGPAVDGTFGELDDGPASVAALRMLVTLSTDDLLKVVERAVAERGELIHTGKTHDLYAIEHEPTITRVGFSREHLVG